MQLQLAAPLANEGCGSSTEGRSIDGAFQFHHVGSDASDVPKDDCFRQLPVK
jgi:hypothetical protein